MSNDSSSDRFRDESRNQEIDVKPMQVPVGKAVKAFRIEQRISPAQLASRMPRWVTTEHIEELERGAFFPSKELWSHLCDALSCDDRDLWVMAEELLDGVPALADEGDRRDWVGCLMHEQLGGSYEDGIAVAAALECENEMLNALERIDRGAVERRINREDMVALQECCLALKAPPHYRKVVDMLLKFLDGKYGNAYGVVSV